MHEQVEPGRPGAARRPAAAARAGSATGRRRTSKTSGTLGGSRASSARVWAAAGIGGDQHVARRAARRRASRPSTSGGAGAPGDRVQRSPRARCRVADQEGERAAASSARASSSEAAVAPPPEDDRRGPAGRRTVSRSASAAPGMSVLSAAPAAVRPEHQRVGRAGRSGRGRSPRRASAQHRPLERHRQRQPAPRRRRARPGTPASPSASHLHRVVRPSPGPSSRVAGPVQHRRQRVVDRVPEHRAPQRRCVISAARPRSAQYSCSSSLYSRNSS